MPRISSNDVVEILPENLPDNTALAVDNPASATANKTLWGAIKAWIASLYVTKINPTVSGVLTNIGRTVLGGVTDDTTTALQTTTLKTTGNAVVGGKLGIGTGTATPISPIEVIAAGTTIPSLGINIYATANGATPNAYIAPNLTGYRNNDPTTNSGFPRADDVLLSVIGAFMDGTTKRNKGLIYFKAESDFQSGNTNTPSYIQFVVSPGSAIANREAGRFTSKGNMVVNGGLQLFPYTGTGLTVNLGAGSTPPTKPAASESAMGTLWIEGRNFIANSGTYAAPTRLEICLETSSGVYEWKEIYRAGSSPSFVDTTITGRTLLGGAVDDTTTTLQIGGTSSAKSQVKFNATNTCNVGNQVAVDISPIMASDRTTGQSVALSVSPSYSPTGASVNALNTVGVTPTYNGTVNVFWLRGVQVFPTLSATSSGTINLYHGLYISTPVKTTGSTVTITSYNGIIIDNPSTTISITNVYGMTSVINVNGADNRWNIYSVGTAPNYFNGNVCIGSNTNGVEKLQVTGKASVSESLATPAIKLPSSTPSALTGNVNDWDLGNKSFIRAEGGNQDRIITGIVAQSDGHVLYVTNIGTTNKLSFDHESASSIAANRIITTFGGPIEVPPNHTLQLIYDATSARWRELSHM